jgi:hypothetical protein
MWKHQLDVLLVPDEVVVDDENGPAPTCSSAFQAPQSSARCLWWRHTSIDLDDVSELQLNGIREH